MASTVKKVSVSMAAKDLRWLEQRARRQRRSLSSMFTEATQALRQREAREELLAEFGDKAKLTDEEREAIDAEWLGSLSTPER